MKILGKNLDEFKSVESLYWEIEGCLDTLVSDLQRFAVEQRIFAHSSGADYHFVIEGAYLTVLGKINHLFNIHYEDQKAALQRYFKTPAKKKEPLPNPGPIKTEYGSSKIRIQGKNKGDFVDLEDLAKSFEYCLDTLVFDLQDYIFQNHDRKGTPTSKDTEMIGNAFGEAISRVNLCFNTNYESITHCILQYFRDPCRKSG